MKRKMHKKIFLLGISLLLSLCSFGQQYESMPPEIQAKMDQNKRERKAKLDGIALVFLITLDQLDAESKTKLFDLISKDERIQRINFPADGKSVELTCHSQMQLEDINEYIMAVNREIINYVELYRLE